VGAAKTKTSRKHIHSNAAQEARAVDIAIDEDVASDVGEDIDLDVGEDVGKDIGKDVDELLEVAQPRVDDKSDMEENKNVNEAESDEEYIIEKDSKMTMEVRKLASLLVMTQEETCSAVKVCYMMEYGEPDEEDWS
jgi:hypothetical protein